LTIAQMKFKMLLSQDKMIWNRKKLQLEDSRRCKQG
jgi:hypothetical protein